MKKASVLVMLVCVCAVVSEGCRKIGDFTGKWSGSIKEEESVRSGFPENVRLTLDIKSVSRNALEAEMSTCLSDPTDPSVCDPGMFQQVTLQPVEKARNDDLRNMTYGGEPYAIYLMTGSPNDPADPSVMVFVSLHGKDRVEVRLVRGNDLYGVFVLEKDRTN